MKSQQKVKVFSILAAVANQFNAETNMAAAAIIFETAINESEIKDIDKKKMYVAIRNCKTKFALQKLFYNCLLKYEGHGIGERVKEEAFA